MTEPEIAELVRAEVKRQLRAIMADFIDSHERHEREADERMKDAFAQLREISQALAALEMVLRRGQTDA